MVWKSLLSSIVVALLIGIMAFALERASVSHMISGDTRTRALEMLMGLMIAYYGNAIPKNLPRFREDQSGRVLALQRTIGWLLTAGGLGFAVVWATAPLAGAPHWSIAVMGAAIGLIAICIFRTHTAQAKARARTNTTVL
jgi:peptidoglycan/LPS O-acetylase OafA/YrhL